MTCVFVRLLDTAAAEQSRHGNDDVTSDESDSVSDDSDEDEDDDDDDDRDNNTVTVSAQQKSWLGKCFSTYTTYDHVAIRITVILSLTL